MKNLKLVLLTLAILAALGACRNPVQDEEAVVLAVPRPGGITTYPDSSQAPVAP